MPVWKENSFFVDDKRSLFYRACLPEKSQGLVLVLHGYAEHAGRYRYVMEYLAARGYESAAPDLRGHGRTARHVGDMDSFEGVLEDLAAFKAHLLDGRRDEPFFIVGHSLGGCLALCLAALHPRSVSGVVVNAPMILVPDYASPWLVAVSRLLAVVLPRLRVQDFRMEDTCRDRAVLEAARRDPLYYRGKMMSRTGYQLLYGIKRARGLLSSVSPPLLVLHGGADRIMQPEGSRLVMDAVRSADKTLRVFDGLYHEILNEPEKDEPLGMIADWLDAHRGA